ncbi:hypothetical protein M406DRAFT_255590 [Cryphonectria parasitica EP155]|uniref:PSP1 C-terminal domain-containing protein n=1 Tax=Cryphonectria parasitica (strain ATCC 38755 / EP155) TaxID=660469 RepID=A0A9P5CQP1_CRYP1|nr:uncharacterized protein M406DRAFT_255590 [Cryphonectria parasitica EP155]KAF3766280.1 hypothetical protein M406DRAFT_255590 [Cryphonectria parasitica EP155]
MSSGILKPGQQNKTGPISLPPGLTPSSQALLLEKINARRGTPDSISEAVASSDDETEAHRQEYPQAIQPQKPIRRASWLSDPSQAGIRPRQGSFASSSMSPTTSHPSTPAADAGATAWGTHSTAPTVMARPHNGSGSFGWGAGIWNNDRKEPPARLAEVLPSPTSSIPSANPLLSSDGATLQTSPAPRDSGTNAQIPFAIPIHPTPKNYRSQSYSVGQADPETPTSATMVGSSGIIGSRGRGVAHPGLQHRPSRPSMLSEMSNEGGMLGKVKEVDDDEDEDVDPLQGQHQSAEAKKIEMLTRENAMLRQQQLHANRMRPRASTGFGVLGNGYGPVMEEPSDYAVDLDDSTDMPADAATKRAFGRRMSEFGSGPFRSSFSLENRPLENVKKAIWSSSLGFGGLVDIPQSRRHSFADVPTRQPSIGSIGDQVAPQEAGPLEAQHAQDFPPSQFDTSMLTQANPSAYFNGPGIAGAQQHMVTSAYGNMYPAVYGMQAPFPNRAPSPHRGLYGIPQPRHAQKLHIVLFKCNRADVFYIQEGTGLTVKPGDLVIVEADRGTDLGTVAKDNVDWAHAKELKEHFAEEHYKWLMMFSQNAAAAQDGTTAGLMAAANGMHGGAVGGMGPPSQHHLQEPNAGELKPKLIKRHAQSHEIQALREKEGSEAKAKRICQSKVKDHGLNMEILDAEFQMDWKKLTFYYFADSYINFNSLVTDLFKIYKTRIWMSAINPASFASPSIALQTPSGIGPGAVGVGRNGPNDRRANQQQEPQAAFANAAATGRPFSGMSASPFGNDRGTTTYSQPSYPYGGNYAGFSNGPRPVANSFVPPVDPYATAFPSGGGDYQLRTRGGFPQSGVTAQQDQPVSPLTTQNDWIGSFQGLSLNSR